MNKVHNKLHADDDDGLPTEIAMLSLVYANQKPAQEAGAAFIRHGVFLTILQAHFSWNLITSRLKICLISQ